MDELRISAPREVHTSATRLRNRVSE